MCPENLRAEIQADSHGTIAVCETLFSVVEEIKKVMGKVQPSTDPQAEETEEMRAIEKAKVIAYRACTGALGIWEIQTQNQPQPEQ